MEKYHSAKVIGDGTYGSVIRAVNSKTGKYSERILSCVGEIVAIKKMKKKYFRWD